MSEEEFFDELLKECRARFEKGDYREAIRALLLCGWNERPMPEWVLEVASEAMKHTFKTGGAPGRGKTGGHAKRLEREQMHRKRHHMADWELGRRKIVGGTREEAFQRASERLLGTPAYGDSIQVERSYNKVQKELRAASK